jgi:hypothetical protein
MPQLRLHTETEHAELHHTDTAQCAVIHCPEKLALPTLCSVHRQLSTPNFEHTSAQWTGWIRLQQVHTSWQTDGQVAATQCCTGLVCINVAQYLAALTYACTAGHTHTQPAVLCCSVNRDLQPADAKGEARAKQVTVVCGMGVTKLPQPHPPNPPPPNSIHGCCLTAWPQCSNSVLQATALGKSSAGCWRRASNKRATHLSCTYAVRVQCCPALDCSEAHSCTYTNPARVYTQL